VSFWFLQWSYAWQVSQLVAEQVLQEELPPMAEDDPALPLEIAAKEETTRLAPQ